MAKTSRKFVRNRRGVRAALSLALVLAVVASSAVLVPGSPAGADGETLAIVVSQVDGTPDWSPDDAPGHDSGDSNGIVRTNDNLTYQVEVAVNDAPATNVTFTLNLAQGTELRAVPPYCTGSGSQLSPASLPEPTVPVTLTSWTSLPSQTLVCNVGNRTANSTFTYPVTTRVRPEVPNGTALTPVDASVVTTDVPEPVVSNTVQATVSARAQFDVSKNAMAADENTGYINTGGGRAACATLSDPDRQCFSYQISTLISAPPGGKGLAPMADSLTFTDDLSPESLYPPGTTTSQAWLDAGADALNTYGAVLDGCQPMSFAQPGHRIGANNPYSGGVFDQTDSVRDSGTTQCTQPGGPGTPVDIAITGMDSTAYTYPDGVTPGGGLAIPADRAYVYSMSLRFLIPVDAVVDLGVAGAGSNWTLAWDNRYTNFEPVGVDGTPNDPDANLAFNDHRGSSSVVQASGGFQKFFTGVPGALGNTPPDEFLPGVPTWEGPSGSTGPQSGEGQLFGGQVTTSTLLFRNTSTLDIERTFLACDAWDPTLTRLTSRVEPGGANIPGRPGPNSQQVFDSGGQPAWLSSYAEGGAGNAVGDPSSVPDLGLIIEYGTGAGGSDAASHCDDDSSPTGWTTDPAAVPGNDPALAAQGVYTAASRVRVYLVMPPGPRNGTFVTINVGLQAMPGLDSGTVLPNWANAKAAVGVESPAEMADPDRAWIPNDYDPVANTGDIGDRLRVSTAAARLAKEVRDPNTGEYGTTVPSFTGGQTADFRLRPSITAGVNAEVSVPVVVEDCLPVGQIFQPATSSPPANEVGPVSPPGGELTCGPGETYVRWDLGPQLLNQPIEPIAYSVLIPNAALAGTQINRALVTAEGDVSAVEQRTASAAIEIVQPAGIKIDKLPITPQVEVNLADETNPDPLIWQVDVVNIETDPGPTDLDVIDVLPQQGLNGTDFEGALAFESASVLAGDEPGQQVEILYTDAPTVHVDALDASNDPTTGATWCSLAGGTYTRVLGAGTDADCPSDAADVTGLRVRRPGPLDPSDLVSFELTMMPTGNAAGDVYVNQTAGRATGLQLLVGPVAAPELVVASTVGDRVWDDANVNGIQDPGEAGIPGFEVVLNGTDTDGNLVGPWLTTTDDNGDYRFDGLPSGDYSITFSPSSLAPGQHFTLQDEGTDEAVDSDGDPQTGFATVTLGANAVDLDIDQGVFTADPDIDIIKYINFVDANSAPGVLVEPGSDMFVAFVVTNTGNLDLDPVVVTDDTIAAEDISCPQTALGVGASMTCTASYPAPAADTQHTNVSTVVGTPLPLPNGVQLDDVTDDDPANAYGIVREVGITKDLAGDPVPNGDGTYTVGYDVVVTNLGTQPATYDLDDDLRFGDGATVEGATVVSGPAGVALNPDWNGLDITRIATGVAVGVGVSHTYRIEATASFDTVVVTGDTSDCQLTGTETGTGFLNGATLTFEGDTTEVDACAPFPDTTFRKDLAGSPVANGDGTYTVTYDIVVTNEGAADDRYDLSDELLFGDNLDVVSSAIANTDPGSIVTDPDWNGLDQLTVVADEPIASGASHTYRVTVVARVDAELTLEQSDCTLLPGEDGTGFLNGATLTVNGIETDDDACAPAPNTSMRKELVGDPVVRGDNTVDVTYEIIVTNQGASADVYDLTDELTYGNDMTVNSASVVNSVPGTVDTNPDWDGLTDLVVATDVLIGGSTGEPVVHRYTVVVNGQLGPETTIEQSDCTVQPGEDGTGFLNGATLTVNGIEIDDDACAEVPPQVVVDKEVVGEPTANGDGTWTIDYEVVVTNVGPAPTVYDLTDRLRFADGVTVIDAEVANTSPGSIPTNPNWDGIDDLQVSSDVPIGVQAVHRYGVTATADVPFSLPDGQTDCDLTEGELGTGFLNETVMTWPGGTDEAEACEQIPLFSIVKDIAEGPTVSDSGQVVLTYSLTVENLGTALGQYDLTDELLWGAGLTVLDASVVTVPAGTPPTNPDWNGIDDLLVVADVSLEPGGVHVWEIRVVGQRSRTMTERSGDCQLSAGESGTGLLNSATVTSNGLSADSEACAPVDRPPERPEVPANPDRPRSTPLPRRGPLPRTGAELGGLALLGLALVASGAVLGRVRRFRSP